MDDRETRINLLNKARGLKTEKPQEIILEVEEDKNQDVLFDILNTDKKEVIEETTTKKKKVKKPASLNEETVSTGTIKVD